MAVDLTSKRYRVEDLDAVEFCFQQGWTDGLPVIPPTPERVEAMLAAARLDPKQEIAFITNRQEATLLKTDKYKQQIAEALLAGVLRYQQALKKVPAIAAQRP